MSALRWRDSEDAHGWAGNALLWRMPEMIKVFYGEDRIAARKTIDKLLGGDYEVIEAENLQPSDMASVFLGVSLFCEKRALLVKDLSANKDCWDLLPSFMDECPHDVILWETKLDKRSTTYKTLSKN